MDSINHHITLFESLLLRWKLITDRIEDGSPLTTAVAILEADASSLARLLRDAQASAIKLEASAQALEQERAEVRRLKDDALACKKSDAAMKSLRDDVASLSTRLDSLSALPSIHQALDELNSKVKPVSTIEAKLDSFNTLPASSRSIEQALNELNSKVEPLSTIGANVDSLTSLPASATSTEQTLRRLAYDIKAISNIQINIDRFAGLPASSLAMQQTLIDLTSKIEQTSHREPKIGSLASRTHDLCTLGQDIQDLVSILPTVQSDVGQLLEMSQAARARLDSLRPVQKFLENLLQSFSQSRTQDAARNVQLARVNERLDRMHGDIPATIKMLENIDGTTRSVQDHIRKIDPNVKRAASLLHKLTVQQASTPEGRGKLQGTEADTNTSTGLAMAPRKRRRLEQGSDVDSLYFSLIVNTEAISPRAQIPAADQETNPQNLDRIVQWAKYTEPVITILSHLIPWDGPELWDIHELVSLVTNCLAKERNASRFLVVYMQRGDFQPGVWYCIQTLCGGSIDHAKLNGDRGTCIWCSRNGRRKCIQLQGPAIPGIRAMVRIIDQEVIR